MNNAINPRVLGVSDLERLVERLNEAIDLVIATVCAPSDEGRAERFQEALWLIRETRAALETAIPGSPVSLVDDVAHANGGAS